MKTKIWLLLVLLTPCLAFCQGGTYDFEGENITHAEGKAAQSKNFICTLTGDGDTDNQEWAIVEDSSAPSPKKVLAIKKADAVDTCWPMALLKGTQYQDVVVSVKFKITGGTVNQAGGIVFRARDANHSYLLRASAKDSSVVLLRINKSERTKLASAKATVGVNRWNTLKVSCKGSEIIAYLNDVKLFSAKDAVYPNGKVGVIGQADSITYFDDFSVSTPQ